MKWYLLGLFITIFAIFKWMQTEHKFIQEETPTLTGISKEYVESIKAPAIVVFFASWCGVCAKEMPLLNKIQEEQDVPLYGIAVQDREENLSPWLDKLGNPFNEITMDSNGSLLQSFGGTGVPTFFVIKHGEVLYKHTGNLSKNVLFTQILPLLR